MSLNIPGASAPSEDNDAPRRFGLIGGILAFCFFFAAAC
jgi:hypothetical protein